MTTLAIPQPSTAATTWNIDPVHSSAEFKVKHMMISNVRDTSPNSRGRLTLNESAVAKSHVEATIEAASIDTREPQRDTHLKSADFLDVEKFPTLSFKSTAIKAVHDGELAVDRRPDDPWRHPQGSVQRGGAHSRCEGSMGKHARGNFGDDEDSAQRFRADLECGA